MSHPTPEMNTEGDVLGVRIVAAIIDLFLANIIGGIVGGIVGLLLGSMSVITVLSVVIFFLYFIVLEGKYGQTGGKRLLSLTVVHDDGSPCTMTSSAIRNVLRVIDGFAAYLLGLVVILLTDRNQRIGDLAGGTVVVRTE